MSGGASSRDYVKMIGLTLVISIVSVVGFSYFTGDNNIFKEVIDNNHNKEDDPVNNGSGVWSEVVDISNSEDAQFDEHENYIEEDFITKDGVIHMKSPHRISSSENGNSSDTDTVATE